MRQIGIRPQDIIVFERYASEFIGAGYEKVMGEREMEGVRWLASGTGYSDQQLAITGVDNPDAHSPELLKHVAGYDPDAFVHMGFAAPEDRRGVLGYGSLADVLDTLEQAVSASDYLAGGRFSAADLYLGAQLGWGMQFGTIGKRPAFERYWSRLADRPAALRAKAIDDALVAERGKGAAQG